MDILDNINVVHKDSDKFRKYFYRLIKTNFRSRDTFGIEVERQDFEKDKLCSIERESIPIISYKKEEVQALLEILYKNMVSPIHVVDIIGENIDDMAYQFE